MKHYFSKSRLITAAWMLFAVIMSTWWIRNQISDDFDENNTTSGLPLIEVKDAVMYAYDKEGNNNLILESPKTEYFQSDKGTIFHQAKLKQLQNNTINTISADTVTENKAQTELDLKGNVIINHSDPSDPRRNTVMKTNQAYYYIDKQLADTDQKVTIITPDSTNYGQGASWFLDNNIFKLKKFIRTQYETDSNS